VIRFIRIRNFKGIHDLGPLSLDAFHVLVGPNASGKSTFLEAIDFIRSCIQTNPRQAVEERVPAFRDLTFMRRGGPILIRVVLDLSTTLPSSQGFVLSYTVRLSADERLGVRVGTELLLRLRQRVSFSQSRQTDPPRLVGKTKNGKDFYRRESGTYTDVFDFGPGRLALSLTPPDESRYPSANAAKAFLTQGVRYLQLNSRAMRNPCPATRPTELELDGTNLARVVGRLVKRPNGGPAASSEEGDPLERWTEHLRYAVDDLQEIGWAARAPDNAEYITLKYTDGLECPSWLLSDGTLRMLALTLPAFLPAAPRIYMVEEPEDGVHPKALEIILKALAAIPSAQVFVATHSPLVVQQAGVKPLLCFSRDDKGVHVVHGKDHPVLKEWNGVPDLGSIFSSRVLG
jgi:energy-coupling factor transporter ATP-binding protein EcfA2